LKRSTPAKRAGRVLGQLSLARGACFFFFETAWNPNARMELRNGNDYHREPVLTMPTMCKKGILVSNFRWARETINLQWSGETYIRPNHGREFKGSGNNIPANIDSPVGGNTTITRENPPGETPGLHQSCGSKYPTTQCFQTPPSISGALHLLVAANTQRGGKKQKKGGRVSTAGRQRTAKERIIRAFFT